MIQEVLRTPRLTLRPCDAADVDLLHRHWTEPEVRRYLWDARIIGSDTVREFVHASTESSRRGGYGLWVILGAPAAAFHGVCGLRDGTLQSPELLFSIAAQHWGVGIATESAQAVLRHAFETLGLREIVATVDKPNTASMRVLEKLGFVVTGEQLIQGNPIVQYSASAECFQNARSR